MEIPSQVTENAPGCKEAVRKLLRIFGIFVASLVLLVLCCVVAKIPPQIFGNNQDHFRAHVISPIPESVEILDVAFDDLIILPDVVYYFRFLVDRNDLEKIMSSRDLEATDGECSGASYPPAWWDVSSLNGIEKYEYQSSDGLIIALCYHASSKTAYYMFFTY